VRSVLEPTLGLLALWAWAAPLSAAPTPAGEPAEARAGDNLRASFEALRDADIGRLLSDRSYAGEILGHVERIEAIIPGNAELQSALDTMRLLALGTLERDDEVRAIVERTLADRPRTTQGYAGALSAATRLEDFPLTAEILDQASRAVPASEWAALRDLMPRRNWSALLQQMREHGDMAARARTAGALFRIGWPGGGDASGVDFLRSILIDHLLSEGDRTGAAEYAAGISTLGTLLPMIVERRYDEIVSPGEDRLAVVERAIQTEDRNTAAALASAPRDQRILLERAQFLRSVDRDAEALALLQPHLGDVAATAAASDQGIWLINEAAFALTDLDRTDEAMELMAQIWTLPIETQPDVIGPIINSAEMLWEIGRPGEAYERVQRIDADLSRYASDYGKMWVWSTAVCALTDLDREPDIAPWLERMQAHAAANEAALTMAHLCRGDVDSAETVMLRRLRSENPSQAILVFQDWRPQHGPANERRLRDRVRALRDRPAIAAELERIGRVLPMPLVGTYWGAI
jgi:hypothetical protein